MPAMANSMRRMTSVAFCWPTHATHERVSITCKEGSCSGEEISKHCAGLPSGQSAHSCPLLSHQQQLLRLAASPKRQLTLQPLPLNRVPSLQRMVAPWVYREKGLVGSTPGGEGGGRGGGGEGGRRSGGGGEGGTLCCGGGGEGGSGAVPPQVAGSGSRARATP